MAHFALIGRINGGDGKFPFVTVRFSKNHRPYQTCHRRFQQWQRDGTLTELLHALAEDLRARGKLDLSETFIDASFSPAKKRACCRPDSPRKRR